MTSITKKSSIGDKVSISIGEFIIFNSSKTYTVNSSGIISLPFDNQISIIGEIYQPIQFISNSGSPPIDLIAGKTYWIIPSTLTKTSFKIAESIEDAISGKAITISDSNQSGNQYCVPYANIAISDKGVYSPIGVNVLAVNLPEGEWEIWGNVVWNNTFPKSGTPGYVAAGFSTTSATLVPSWSSKYSVSIPSFPIGWMTQNISPVYFQLTEMSIVYMVAQAGYGSGTLGACGYMIAKKIG